jgi:hypothetical protein
MVFIKPHAHIGIAGIARTYIDLNKANELLACAAGAIDRYTGSTANDPDL